MTSLRSLSLKMRSFAAIVAFASLAFSAVASALPAVPPTSDVTNVLDTVCVQMLYDWFPPF